MSSFDHRMKQLDAEIRALKAASSFGTSSITATSKTVQVEIEMHYWTTSGGANEYCTSKYRACIEIVPDGNEAFICSIEVASGQSNLNGRDFRLAQNMKNGHHCYMVFVSHGTAQDLQTTKNGGTVKFNLTFRIVSTSPFTTSTTYEES